MDELKQIEERMAEIVTELETADEERMTALESETETLEQRKNDIIEQRKKDIAEVINGGGEEIEKIKEKTMDINEIRNSKEYINAFANYIKTGRDDEVRALLTTNATAATGYVPVPEIIEGRIRTAWGKLGIMDLVNKTFIKGNLKVAFELSADGANVHAEGAAAPSAENLTFGVVEMKPESIKKWIKISDEAMDMGGEEFLYYIYDEVTYRIAKKAQEELLAKIVACTASATATMPGVGVVAGTPSLGIVANAIGRLSDEADNPVIVMNKLTWAQFKAVQYANYYNVDLFEGLDVHFDSTLPAYTATGTTGSTWMIVGDFGVGAQANFPNGDEITLKYDDLSLAESDLVKIVGREYVGLGVVADKAFCKVTF